MKLRRALAVLLTAWAPGLVGCELVVDVDRTRLLDGAVIPDAADGNIDAGSRTDGGARDAGADASDAGGDASDGSSDAAADVDASPMDGAIPADGAADATLDTGDSAASDGASDA